MLTSLVAWAPKGPPPRGGILTQPKLLGASFVYVQQTGVRLGIDPEAEIVAMGTTMRVIALPLFSLTDEVFDVSRVRVWG